MRRYRRGAQDFFPRGGSWHVCCIQCEAGEVRSFIPSFALTPTGGSAYRRPPVWRAVVRPARYFLMGPKSPSALRPSASRERSGRRQKASFLPAKSRPVESRESVSASITALSVPPTFLPSARRCRNQQAWGRGGRSRPRWRRLRRLSMRSRSRRLRACDVQPAVDVTS
jgi:hypothetical protein